MKKVLLLVLMGIFFASCATPQGVTKNDQRDYILKMKDETLGKLYKTNPETKKMGT